VGLVAFGADTLGGSWARVGLLIVMAALTLVFLSQAQRRAREAEAQARQLSSLATHLQALSEKEKSALARRLHDELGGLLTAAKMDLSWLEKRIETTPLRERLGQLSAVLDQAMALKRHVVEELRPSLLEHFGLATALRAHVEAACTAAGLEQEITLPEDVGAMPRDTAIALFRIIEEGLANTIRHAKARTVRLTLTVEGGSYALELSDDGVTREPGGIAITAMQHRIRNLGGELQLVSAPGTGTSLRVRVPAQA
jgi:signal transduction histidine kinase